MILVGIFRGRICLGGNFPYTVDTILNHRNYYLLIPFMGVKFPGFKWLSAKTCSFFIPINLFVLCFAKKVSQIGRANITA